MTTAKEEDCPCAPGMIKKDGKCVMPDVTFTSFFMALNTSALFHLGVVPDPKTGLKNVDKMMAKHTIDTMNMLQKKSVGNLTVEENDLVEKILYDLKMRYVNA
nr:DUF1844 domain-containing protein [Desulfobulbaceae bacterium]